MVKNSRIRNKLLATSAVNAHVIVNNDSKIRVNLNYLLTDYGNEINNDDNSSAMLKQTIA